MYRGPDGWRPPCTTHCVNPYESQATPIFPRHPVLHHAEQHMEHEAESQAAAAPAPQHNVLGRASPQQVAGRPMNAWVSWLCPWRSHPNALRHNLLPKRCPLETKGLQCSGVLHCQVTEHHLHPSLMIHRPAAPVHVPTHRVAARGACTHHPHTPTSTPPLEGTRTVEAAPGGRMCSCSQGPPVGQPETNTSGAGMQGRLQLAGCASAGLSGTTRQEPAPAPTLMHPYLCNPRRNNRTGPPTHTVGLAGSCNTDHTAARSGSSSLWAGCCEEGRK